MPPQNPHSSLLFAWTRVCGWARECAESLVLLFVFFHGRSYDSGMMSRYDDPVEVMGGWWREEYMTGLDPLAIRNM